MKGIVDRIEGDYVVLEIGEEIKNIEKEKFPEDVREGDIVEFRENKYIILREKTEKRKKTMEELFNKLKE
ncbi:DUF3006 domain-containing protein [Anaerosalibacter bizertensis]|uniref:DUF3006 domain-containing protein n=1 Tax=Anaerosalibacter bizertensis TaxID=932217 RepID=A0A844FJK8_9FIRM|nr:DUF3006 domain-containing protein [Anaerosalibacter bizertensis]MBV1819735.1 DUF3006 domain-containing protein [Bacteroidales bacterium MSK.15.36]HHV27783.1 DUF3006 domain-containing protein [Tissierellia bacterium]MBU5293417.1 DUF3006 domain-containing protein [Anaerosalibacter bizertensis]MCB5560241.1 DUF3006 domain-containing protein [Anaerosalibacter bizertensis]MCG4564059.1 DUF3006 domain-containing protein [Anaerosalibacter bizertensis]